MFACPQGQLKCQRNGRRVPREQRLRSRDPSDAPVNTRLGASRAWPPLPCPELLSPPVRGSGRPGGGFRAGRAGFPPGAARRCPCQCVNEPRSDAPAFPRAFLRGVLVRNRLFLSSSTRGWNRLDAGTARAVAVQRVRVGERGSRQTRN